MAILNDSSEAVGFSKMKSAQNLSSKGTLTPDLVIRTKPFAWVINKDLNKSADIFVKNYHNYFQKYKKRNHKKLNDGPKWALWVGKGTICFGS